LEGLRLAQADAQRGSLDDDQMRRIRDAVAELVDDLGTHSDVDERPLLEEDSPLAHLERAEAKVEEQALPEQWRQGKPILCIPGPSLLDEALATIVMHLVERRGVGARAEQVDALSMARISNWDTAGVALICLCYLEAATPAQIRYSIRRIHRRIPDVKIVVACLGRSENVVIDETLIAGVQYVRESLRATVDRIMTVALAQTPEKAPRESHVTLVS
jgi:hypothetical protein